MIFSYCSVMGTGRKVPSHLICLSYCGQIPNNSNLKEEELILAHTLRGCGPSNLARKHGSKSIRPLNAMHLWLESGEMVVDGQLINSFFLFI